MATAKTETLLPLDRFARLCGIHPMHFNQVYMGDINEFCGTVWLQYMWQNGKSSSREEVATAIRSAEDSLEEYLGFPVAPKWIADKNVKIGDQALRITLPKGYYIQGGKKTVDLIEDGVEITYSTDFTGSTYNERATIEVATTVTDPLEIAICYPDEEFSQWQIRPIKVDIDSGMATIICERHQLVKKEYLEAFAPGAVQGDDDEKFLTHVDVYRVYNDPETQILLQSVGCCGCSSCANCETCTFNVETGCMRAVHADWGIVDASPGTWNGTGFDSIACMSGHIFNMRTWFKAGWPLENGEMHHMWADAVAKLALSRLANPLCPCEKVQEKLGWWTMDLGTNKNTTGSHKIPEHLRNCPWGYTRGALYAYSIAMNHKIGQGKR